MSKLPVGIFLVSHFIAEEYPYRKISPIYVRCSDHLSLTEHNYCSNLICVKRFRGIQGLHLDEQTLIIDGFKGLIVDFLSVLVLFL